MLPFAVLSPVKQRAPALSLSQFPPVFALSRKMIHVLYLKHQHRQQAKKNGEAKRVDMFCRSPQN